MMKEHTYRHAPPPMPQRQIAEDTPIEYADQPLVGDVRCAPALGGVNSSTGSAGCSFKPRTPGLPSDSAARKEFPMCTGVLDYFTAALAEVAHVSWVGNQKHNPGQPLHHARGKSMDHADCIVRHTSERGGWDRFEWTDASGASQVRWVMHSAYVAWRALADLQQECEDMGAPRARSAR